MLRVSSRARIGAPIAVAATTPNVGSVSVRDEKAIVDFASVVYLVRIGMPVEVATCCGRRRYLSRAASSDAIISIFSVPSVQATPETA